ncbi:MAG: tRNA (guanosine(37)-N1)-methyltransferase TrmD [Cyanobacteriota bacterium]
MKINILTLFPEFFISPLNTSILKRAIESNLIEVNIINIRDFCTDKHKRADDSPFGGGCGMVMKAEPIFSSIKSIENFSNIRRIFTCPTGKKYTQTVAEELAKENELIILCGHYEGVDQRIRDNLITDEYSIGDYVLTGGETASLAIIESIARLIPNVLGNEDSAKQDSFSDGLLDCPHYTRPSEFNGWKVPDILLSGNHQKIEEWRLKEKFKITLIKRPELIDKYVFNKKSKMIFETAKKEI